MNIVQLNIQILISSKIRDILYSILSAILKENESTTLYIFA